MGGVQENFIWNSMSKRFKCKTLQEKQKKNRIDLRVIETRIITFSLNVHSIFFKLTNICSILRLYRKFSKIWIALKDVVDLIHHQVLIISINLVEAQLYTLSKTFYIVHIVSSPTTINIAIEQKCSTVITELHMLVAISL